jgi:UrcA family protein
MNIPVKIPDRSQYDSPYGKLALMALCSLLLIGAIAKQLPASAADKSAAVSLADLDLSTEKGMQAARDRLHQTARWLCQRVVNPWSLSHQSDYVRCVNNATSAAVARLQEPQRVANAKAHAQGVSTR